MSMQSKKVFLIGPSGVGKSYVGNELLGLLPRAQPERSLPAGFKSTMDTKSVTTDIGHRTRFVTGLGEKGAVTKARLRLQVFDTPGVPDSEFRSRKFLDDIMKRIIVEKPQGIVIVLASNRLTPDVANILQALQECLGAKMGCSNVLFLLNKMPSNKSLKKDNKTLQQMVQSWTQGLERTLGTELSGSVFANQYDETRGISLLRQRLAMLPSHCVGTEDIRPWSKVLSDAKATKSPTGAATAMLKKKGNQIKELRKEAEWYMSQHAVMKDTKLAAAAAAAWLATPLAGAAVGEILHVASGMMNNRYKDLQKKIKSEERGLEALKKDKDVANKGLVAWEARKRRLERLEKLVDSPSDKPKSKL